MIEAEQNPGDAGETAVETTPTLADVVKERGALPEPELLTTFLQVLADLESAHGQEMLHRDISPARITIVAGNWKLTEYGSAKVGTVWYMSPERCQGKPLDARSDIYSLGVVMFEAATGRVPFDAEMKFQIMEAHVNTPPPSPRAINEAVSPELEQVILRALSKDPADRFQSSGEFKQALEGLAGVSGQPSGPSVQPAAEPVEKPSAEVQPASRRVKLVAILVPLAGAIAVVAGLFLTGVIGARRVPLVTGISGDEAEQVLRGKGFHVETDTVDDTLPAGIVVTQVPTAGAKGPRSRVVELSVSAGTVEMPSLAGLSLPDARAQLARLALTEVKVDSQYSDDYAVGIVAAASIEAGTKVVPRASVGLTVSAGRATCPDCGARREPRAKFCTKCGYQF